YNVTVQTVKNILKKFRFSFKSKKSNNTKVTKEQSLEIVRSYKKDRSATNLQKLADDFGVTTATIRNVLKKSNVYKSTNKPHVRLSDEKKLEMIQEYRNGKSGRLIAEKFGVSYQHVYDILKKQEVGRRKLTDYDRAYKVPVSEHCEIVKRYNKGVSGNVLAKEYDVSVSLIFQILGKNDVNVRPVQIVSPDEYDNITDMYITKKMSTYQIGSEYSVHANTIYAILKKLKVKMRPKWYKKILPTKYPRIIERYRKGDSVEKIAKAYSVTTNSIKYILEKLHVETPNPKFRKH
ncbi:unnamed protein product, partial [marine sediment metagenome]